MRFDMTDTQKENLRGISVELDNIHDELQELATEITDSNEVTNIYEAMIRVVQADKELKFVWD